MAVRIGNVERIAGKAEAGRFVEKRVAQPAGRLAQERRAGSLHRIEDLDLAVVGVGDIEQPSMIGDSQGMLQANSRARAVVVAELEEPLADQRRYFARTIERQG